MTANRLEVIVVSGTSRGIGRTLAEYYCRKGMQVIGCSRNSTNLDLANYRHFCLDISEEEAVKNMFSEIRQSYGQLDVLINNAGIASMNHALLTPLSTVRRILSTNVVGTFLFCREAAKLMQKNRFGRIVNFTTASTILKLEGELMYAASKSAIVTLTEILAKELAELGITVNAVGPPAISTDLIRSVPTEKMNRYLDRHAIKRFGEVGDVANVIDFFIKPESNLVTGQVVFLGGP